MEGFNVVISTIGIVIAILQTIIILFLMGIKSDIRELWKRLYGHYHEIDCENPDCQRIKTGNVIVPHEVG